MASETGKMIQTWRLATPQQKDLLRAKDPAMAGHLDALVLMLEGQSKNESPINSESPHKT